MKGDRHPGIRTVRAEEALDAANNVARVGCKGLSGQRRTHGDRREPGDDGTNGDGGERRYGQCGLTELEDLGGCGYDAMA